MQKNQSQRAPRSGRSNNRPQGGNRRGGRGSSRRSGSRPKQYINPEKFINKNVKAVETEVYEPKHRFSDFGLIKQLENNLLQAGFRTPSPIQDQTIPIGLERKDVIGLANTGTGKTAAFLVPILQRRDAFRAPQSTLIMAPTRELAQQIDAEFKKFSGGMRLYSALCVGGMNITAQIRQIKRGPQLIIGTPGRLKDLMEQGVLTFEQLDTLVLDEADRMLDMGFIHDIKAIVRELPDNRQTMCFSATMSDGIKQIVHDFMHQPELVSVKTSETNDHIYQDVVAFSDEEHKRELLTELLARDEVSKVIIFGETKYGVQRLSDKLEKAGISAQAIHGNKSQSQRTKALARFASDKARVLVATDVAARGIDVPNVSHVINFDLPQTYDDYVHRIGRTGRGGSSGTALTFVPAKKRR